MFRSFQRGIMVVNTSKSESARKFKNVERIPSVELGVHLHYSCGRKWQMCKFVWSRCTKKKLLYENAHPDNIYIINLYPESTQIFKMMMITYDPSRVNLQTPFNFIILFIIEVNGAIINLLRQSRDDVYSRYHKNYSWRSLDHSCEWSHSVLVQLIVSIWVFL